MEAYPFKKSSAECTLPLHPSSSCWYLNSITFSAILSFQLWVFLRMCFIYSCVFPQPKDSGTWSRLTDGDDIRRYFKWTNKQIKNPKYQKPQNNNKIPQTKKAPKSFATLWTWDILSACEVFLCSILLYSFGYSWGGLMSVRSIPSWFISLSGLPCKASLFWQTYLLL